MRETEAHRGAVLKVIDRAQPGLDSCLKRLPAVGKIHEAGSQKVPWNSSQIHMTSEALSLHWGSGILSTKRRKELEEPKDSLKAELPIQEVFFLFKGEMVLAFNLIVWHYAGC